jgi:CheY-like chemotaxis protein
MNARTWSKNASSAPTTGTRVLVVDDNAMVRRAIVRGLVRAGFEVLEAAGGVEAVEIYASSSPAVNVVVLDVEMPEMDGFEVLRELRRIHPHVRVVFCSGRPDESTVEKAIREGASSFVSKPFTGSCLVAAVARALGEGKHRNASYVRATGPEADG